MMKPERLISAIQRLIIIALIPNGVSLAQSRTTTTAPIHQSDSLQVDLYTSEQDKARYTTNPPIYRGDSLQVKEEQEFLHQHNKKHLQTAINTTDKEISDNDARLQQINATLLARQKFTVQQTVNNNYAEEIKTLKTEKETLEAKQSLLRPKLQTLNKQMKSMKQP